MGLWVHWMMHKLGHTPYINKQIIKLVIASLMTNTMSGNHMCVESQNDPTFHQHVIQGLDVVMGETLFVFIHFSTPTVRNYFLIWTAWPYAQHGLVPYMDVNPTRTSHACKYAIIGASSWMSRTTLPSNSIS